MTRVPLATSSDAPPATPNVAITIGATTTVIRDAVVVAALQDLSADQLRDAIRKAMGLGGLDQATG